MLVDQDRHYVYVLDARSRAQRKNVRVGRVLDDGLRVVSSGLATERPRDRVRRAEDFVARHAGAAGRDRDGRAAAGCGAVDKRRRIDDAGAAETRLMDLARFFVDRPIFAAVLSIVILLVGLLRSRCCRSASIPEVVPPTVQVRAIYPGANPKVIADTVATPLEEAINGVEGMMYMKSVAGSDGVLQMTVTFRHGTDPDLAQVQVQNRVQPGARAPARGRAAPGRHHRKSSRRT